MRLGFVKIIVHKKFGKQRVDLANIICPAAGYSSMARNGTLQNYFKLDKGVNAKYPLPDPNLSHTSFGEYSCFSVELSL